MSITNFYPKYTYLLDYNMAVDILAGMAPSPMAPVTNDRIFYVVDPYKGSSGYLSAPEPVNPSPLNLYRISRDENDVEEPVLVYALRKDSKTRKELKKILLDPDNGIIITQSDDQTVDPEISKR